MSILVLGRSCSRTVGSASSFVAKCTTSPPLMAAVCDPCSLGANGDHKVDTQHGRQSAGVEVGLIRQISQLAHVAQHRHPAFTVRAAKDLQRRGHGLGIGVVAIIQQHPSPRQADDPHSGAGRLLSWKSTWAHFRATISSRLRPSSSPTATAMDAE